MIDEKKLIEQLKGYKSEWKLAEPFHEGIANGLKIAIEATEKQPKVEKCADCSRRKFWWQGYKDGLNENRWIPCSERLPTEKEAWNCNEEEGTHEPNEFIVQVKGAELPTVAMFDGEEFTHGYADDGYGFCDEIIAWMPLPEPYKAGDT